jgi:hypothetical protein
MILLADGLLVYTPEDFKSLSDKLCKKISKDFCILLIAVLDEVLSMKIKE